MNPDATTPSDAHRRLELLQSELAARASTLHFAHAAVSMVTSLIVAGAAGKLLWDLPHGKQLLALPVVALTAVLILYALVRYLRGKKALAIELHRFESLKALRRDLNLDNPAALLPR